jgi:hypothetical protein
VQDAYVGGLSKTVQDSYKAYKDRLSAWDATKVGQDLIGVQKGGGAAKVPSSKVLGNIVAGGRDTIQQAKALAGEAPVKEAVRSYVQHKVMGLDAAGIQKLIKDPKFSEVLTTDPDLARGVTMHLNSVQRAEQAGTTATRLGEQAEASRARTAAYEKQADALMGGAKSAADRAKVRQRAIADLETLPPEKVGAEYERMLNEAHQRGDINLQQYKDGQKLAATAERDFKVKATRDAAIKGMLTTVGAGGAYAMAGPAGLAAAGAAGAGGMLALATRRKIFRNAPKH